MFGLLLMLLRIGVVLVVIVKYTQIFKLSSDYKFILIVYLFLCVFYMFCPLNTPEHTILTGFMQEFSKP